MPFGHGHETIPQEIFNLAEWCGGGEGYDYIRGHWFIVIPTLEGSMRALPGDYIIRGVQGEFYPCKPDIFEQTYERVEE